MLNYCLSIVLILTVGQILGENCFNNDIEKIHQHLGTKTPYRFVQNENNSIINVEGNLLLNLYIIFTYRNLHKE